VQVEFPAGALSQNAEVTYRAKRIKPLALSRKRATAIQFDLDALSASAQPVSQFAQPLTLTVSVKGLIDLKQIPQGMYATLAYQAQDGHWVEVATHVNQQQGTLSAHLNHFTSFGAGVMPGTPGVWAFAYNPPQTSLFGGTATYRIPLEVPPGRNGLQPDLALSYSSARINGRTGADKVERGPVGDSWSIDVMDISRERWWGCDWIDNEGLVST